MGALEVDKVVLGHQVWCLLSCMWLHGGDIHVLANMLSLVFIGIRLEQEFGFGKVLVIILVLFKYIIITSVTNNVQVFVYIFIVCYRDVVEEASF